MELRHLRYFIQVADELHFARAAARLGISQPPLSLQIRQLEEEVGIQLLERTSRRVALTPAGALFLDAAREAVLQADRAVEVARRAARGELGDLAVGFNASAPFVPPIAAAIHQFRQSYPDVTLSLSEITAPAQIAAVAARELDIGFIRSAGSPILPAEVVATRVLSEGLFVAMRADHPLAERTGLRLADLSGQPLVVYVSEKSGGFTEGILSMLSHAGVEPVIAQSVREVSTLLGLAAAGVGVAIIPASLGALQSAGLSYQPVLDDQARSAMWLIHHQHAASLPCRNFLAIVQVCGTDHPVAKPQ